jgi:MATE family multidrug resistance protein
MIVSLALYFAAWWLMRPLGNAGLWIAILLFFGSRGGPAGG